MIFLPKGTFTYDVRFYGGIFDLPTLISKVVATTSGQRQLPILQNPVAALNCIWLPVVMNLNYLLLTRPLLGLLRMEFRFLFIFSLTENSIQ